MKKIPFHRFALRTHSLGTVSSRKLGKSILTVVTVTRNPRQCLLDVAKDVQGQSLRMIEWLIVNDHSDNPSSLAILYSIVRSDPLIRLVDSASAPGYANAINFGLARVRTKYWAFLDDDDLMELTSYEKAVWMLETVPSAHMIGYYSVNYGAKNFSWTNGWHQAEKNFRDNGMPVASVVRSSVLSSPCRVELEGAGDWDFWLCNAEHGAWGLTLPEYLFWYRVNDDAFRKVRWSNLVPDAGQTTRVAEVMRLRHPRLFEGNFSLRVPKVTPYTDGEVELTPPFWNPLPRSGRAVVFVLSYLMVGGSGMNLLRLVKLLVFGGVHVTLVCTLSTNSGAEMLSEFMGLTHDVFTLPNFLPLKWWPAFCSYLLDSRKPTAWVVVDSQVGYALLPYMRSRHPEVRVLDYVHALERGGSANMSLEKAAYLCGTLVSGSFIKTWMENKGRNSESVAVARVGVSVLPRLPAFTIRNSVTIVMVARLEDRMRPLLAVEVFAEVVHETQKLGIKQLFFRLIGDGPLRKDVASYVAMSGLGENVVLSGMLQPSQVAEALRNSDVFFLPSLEEGISLVVGEAVSQSLPVVTSAAGGMRELVREECGYLVPLNISVTEQRGIYIKHLVALVKNVNLRRRLGQEGRRQVESMFDEAKLTRALAGAIEHASCRAHPESRGTARSLAASALREIAVELRPLSDLGLIQRKLQSPRTGVGKVLEMYCAGSANLDLEQWIDSLHLLLSCAGAIDRNALIRSAVNQCGRRCVFDDDKKDPGFGWVFSGRCWTGFNSSSHPCAVRFGHLKRKRNRAYR
jgi:glycosyltransferase involved in cell wall biosynthesis